MMPTDTTENGLIPQRHKYTVQVYFVPLFTYPILKEGEKNKSAMKPEVSPWETAVKNKV